jgi:hypothetical protein
MTVLPVSGLLAETGATLREDEFAAVHRIAALPPRDLESLLLSVDRVLSHGPTAPGVSLDPVPVRSALLDRLGLTGLRLAVALVGAGACRDASDLSAELLRRSGIDALRSVLVHQFAARSDVLRASTALGVVTATLDRLPRGAAERLRLQAEQIVASAHEFAELRLLEELRTGVIGLPDDQRAAAEALLGAHGDDPRSRLLLAPDASDADVGATLAAVLVDWQRTAENPFAEGGLRRAAQVLRRTCEGLAVAGSAPARNES